MVWHRIAHLTGRTLAEARNEISYPEYLSWTAFLALEDERENDRRHERDKLDWLFAHLIFRMRETEMGTVKAGRIEDYLLSWKRGAAKPTRTRRGRRQDPQERERLRSLVLGWAKMAKLKTEQS